jgi:hypothetical protein
MMGEPMDSRGVRQSLMARELSDLPQQSLEFAITAWLRGDKEHLSSYEQDRTRIGVFFPKPAELREIAELHAREQRMAKREQARQEREEAERRDRADHPENYLYWDPAEALQELVEKKGFGESSVPEILSPKSSTVCCPHCKQPLPFTAEGLAMLRPEDLRAMADAIERQRA